MQAIATEHLERMAAEGKLDKLSYQKRASISVLLKVPADATWTSDFISAMQQSKAQPAPSGPPGPPQPNQGVSNRAIKMNTNIYATDAQLLGAEGMV